MDEHTDRSVLDSSMHMSMDSVHGQFDVAGVLYLSVRPVQISIIAVPLVICKMPRPVSCRSRQA